MTAPGCFPRMARMKSRGIAARMLCGVVLMLCAATALPQATALYTVEIVVFRNGGTSGALPDTNTPPAAGEDGVDATVVPASKLNAAAGKLRKGGFEVLAHVAWTQAATSFNSHRGVSAATLGLGNAVTGTVSLERGQYLNLRMNLVVESGGHRYRISEVGRVKAGEIRYFDHPAVGVIAIISPATASGAPAATG